MLCSILSTNKMNFMSDMGNSFFMSQTNGAAFCSSSKLLFKFLTFFILVSSTKSQDPISTQRSKVGYIKIIGITTLAYFVFLSFVILLVFLYKRLNSKKEYDVVLPMFAKIAHEKISYEELVMATNGFDRCLLLGKGSFGSVYRGVLRNGNNIAVKVLNLQNNEADKSFKAECNALRKTKHRNLVSLLTVSLRPNFKALIYEYLPHGNLENFLYGIMGHEFGLKKRLEIAIDVARALEYLHHDSSSQIVHCDIKPSNILLDEDMTARVTDFGIARLLCSGAANSSTCLNVSSFDVKGTTGYIAPEYGLGEKMSTRGDVYSFGILLLEIITRKKPTDEMFNGDLTLPNWVNMAFPNHLEAVVDSYLISEIDGEEVQVSNACNSIFSMVHIGLICSHEGPQQRPTMRDVCEALQKIQQNFVRKTAFSQRTISSLLKQSTIRKQGGAGPPPPQQESSTF